MQFAGAERKEKAVRLLCKKHGKDNKMDSIKRHFQQIYSKFGNFLLNDQKGINDISHLNSKLNVQQNVLKWFQTESELINLYSYKWLGFLHKKENNFSIDIWLYSVFLGYYEKRLKRYFTKSERFFSQATQQLPEEDKIF